MIDSDFKILISRKGRNRKKKQSHEVNIWLEQMQFWATGTTSDVSYVSIALSSKNEKEFRSMT